MPQSSARIGAVLIAVAALAGAGPSRAALTYYANRLDFDSDNPGLPVETFEEGTPETNFTGPLDASTNNAVFSPGEILPGLTIDNEISGSSFDLRLQDLGTTLVMSTPNQFRKVVLLFSPAVRSVGMDVYQFNAAGDVSVEVDGASGILGSTSVPTDASATGAFFGVRSSSANITKIVVDDSDIESAVDDVAFGNPGPHLLDLYSSRLAFDSAFPGLPIETFEEGTPETNFTGPLDSSTSNAVFSPGEILPGLTIDNEISGSSFDLRLQDLGTTLVMSTPNQFRKVVLEFAPAATAVGMDVYQFNAAGDAVVEVHDAGGLVATERVPTSQSGAFFGVAALADPITKIVVDDTDITNGVDDVAFVPEPGQLGGAVAALIALAIRRRA